MAAVSVHEPDVDPVSPSSVLQVAEKRRWAELINAMPRPILTHLNEDTTWLLQLPYPSSENVPPGRTRFNILIDPWLRGPQSDVASFFSTQWHVVAPSIATIADLNSVLAEIEQSTVPTNNACAVGSGAVAEREFLIDAVVISHEFTDHCHKDTLMELPRATPIYAADVAADLIRSWEFFDQVITTPALSCGEPWSQLTAVGSSLPGWLAIGRVITPDNALYYHAAVLIAFDLQAGDGAEAVIYSPHGINSDDLAAATKSSGLNTLALLHGLHDVRIWMAKQLNLGALNAVRAAAATNARYWIPTHDEVKKGGGLLAPFLQRTKYTLKDAVAHQQQLLERCGEADTPSCSFVELRSGEGLVLGSSCSNSQAQHDVL